jgi:hypothetical protein
VAKYHIEIRWILLFLRSNETARYDPTQTSITTGLSSAGRRKIRVSEKAGVFVDCLSQSAGLMPKRSNNFQRLILQIRKHVADGATVTESAELIDKVTGTKREVDICMEGAVGGVPTIICIECRAFMRKADVTWVEEMTSKHNNLPTDVLILYSRSGFTKSAVEKAKFYNKRIVTLRALNDVTAEGLFGGTGSLWLKTCSLTPTKIVFSVPAAPGLAAENVNVSPDHIIFNHEGQPIGIAKVWVELEASS